MKELIALRKQRKAKKPNFRRQDSHKKKRIDPRWRKPKGIQSKMRLSIKGYCKIVKNGYGSPTAVKGLSKEGLVKINVGCLKDLESIDNKTQGIIINSQVGDKKRLDLIKKAKELQITILNIKDPDAFVTKVEADIKQKKDAKTAKAKAKSEKEKKKEEKKEEKLEKKVEETEEEKKKQEKKEKDKILTSKRESQ